MSAESCLRSPTPTVAADVVVVVSAAFVFVMYNCRGKPHVIDLGDSAGQASMGVGVVPVSATAKAAGKERVMASAPPGLQEAAITCEAARKDEYLYYFLCRHPGRTIVFVNAISQVLPARCSAWLGSVVLSRFPLVWGGG